jgi:hypothetical protein
MRTVEVAAAVLRSAKENITVTVPQPDREG